MPDGLSRPAGWAVVDGLAFPFGRSHRESARRERRAEVETGARPEKTLLTRSPAAAGPIASDCSSAPLAFETTPRNPTIRTAARISAADPSAASTSTVAGTSITLSQATAAPTQLELGGRSVPMAGGGGFVVRDYAAGTDVGLTGGQVTLNGSGLTYTAVGSGITLRATFTPCEGYVEVKGEVENTQGADRAVIVRFVLPVPATGATFQNTLSQSMTVGATTHVLGTIFPIAAVTGSDWGAALAIPPDSPCCFGMTGSAEGVGVEYYLGLSPDVRAFPNRAAFSFVIDGAHPGWGFRSALQSYYARYPGYYEPRVAGRGFWNWNDPVGLNPPDSSVEEALSLYTFHGFPHSGIYDAQISRDQRLDVYSIAYTITGQRELRSLTDLPADYEAAMTVFHNFADAWAAEDPDGPLHKQYTTNNERNRDVPEQIENSTVFTADQDYLLTLRSSAYAGNSITFTENPNPHLFEDDGRVTVGAVTMAMLEDWMAHDPAAGVHLDSLGGVWPACLNYRREHFAYAQYPLTFDQNGRVALHNNLSHYELIEATRAKALQYGKFLFGNGIDIYSRSTATEQYNTLQHGRFFVSALLDVGAREWTAGWPTRDRLDAYRTFMGRKPMTAVLYDWQNQSTVFRDMNHALAYDVFAAPNRYVGDGISYVGAANGYARDRTFLLWFLDNARMLDAAGWQPVTYARVDQPGVVCERYGEGGVIYFTLLNLGSLVVECNLTIDLESLLPAADMDTQVSEVARGSSLTVSTGGDTVVVHLTLQPDETNIIKLATTAATAAPSITTQPQGRTVSAGESITFTVAASGNPAPIYQWRKDSVDLAGATGAMLTLSNVQSGDAGAYSVVVTNSAGSVVSHDAVLTVSAATAAPSITAQPQGRTVSAGESVTFTVAASGNPAPTYQWRKDGSDLSGATGATLTLTNVDSRNAGMYLVVATNAAGSATSNGAVLTVLPSITVGATRTQYASSGHDVSISARGLSSNSQWQVSKDGGSIWSNLSNDGTYHGVNSSTLTIAATDTSMDGYQYRYVDADGAASTTEVIILSVTAALFPMPTGVATDGAGTWYVSDSSTHTISKVSSRGEVTPLAGASGQSGSTDGRGGNARFNHPNGMAMAMDGTLYVSDGANGLIREVTAAGAVSTLAGAAGVRGNADGMGSAASFSTPVGVAVDASGTLFVADSMNHTIRRITSDGQVTTFAGRAGVSGFSDGTGSDARFNLPTGLTIDTAGNLYVSDATNNTIRKISADGAATTLAGLAGVSGSADGRGSDALFNQPGGLAVDSVGNLYVADTGNSAIRRIASDGTVTTLAGLPGIAGLQDGSGDDAWFNQPSDLTLDTAGDLMVTDTGNASLRKVSPDGAVTTLDLKMAPDDNGGGDHSGSGGSEPSPSPPAAGGGSTGGGGGGGASVWFAGALTLLWAIRLSVRRRDATGA